MIVIVLKGYWINNLKNGHGLYTYEDGRLSKVFCNLDSFVIDNSKDTMILIKRVSIS